MDLDLITADTDRLRVEHGDAHHGARLLLEAPCRTGGLIHRISDYTVTTRPTVHSVQIGPGVHMDGLGKIAFFNHSCDPNTVLDTEAMTIRAVRDLAAGEELTFFYPSTEWAMDQPFLCRCGAPQCVRVVAGAKYLAADVLGRYFVNRHIRDLLLQAVSNPAHDLARACP